MYSYKMILIELQNLLCNVVKILMNFDNFSCKVEGVKASSMVKQIHLLKETRQVMQLPLPGVYQMKK